MGGENNAACVPGDCIAKALRVLLRRGGEVVPDSGERVFPVADVGVLAAELLGALAQEVEVERVDRLADAAKIGAPGIEILKQPQREREDRICEWIGLDTVGIPSQRLADASRVERGLSRIRIRI